MRLCLFAMALAACVCAAQAAEKATDQIPADKGPINIRPIEHASLVLTWNGKTIYVDPVGGAAKYANVPRPDVILLTDIHGDHLDLATLKQIVPQDSAAKIVAPKAVVEKLEDESLRRRAVTVAAGQRVEAAGVPITVMLAYNLAEERQKFHPKGRGVGYVVELGGKKIYIAGDTEDIPEMRKLQGIDAALMPMNLPYTMSVEQAADAIRAFKPKVVYPYHFRNADKSKSDLEKLRKLVGEATEIRVLDWYPQ